MNVTYPIIKFGSNSIAIADDVLSITAPNKQATAFLNDVYTGLTATKPFITYEPNFWLLDGGYKFLGVGSQHIGWISSGISDNGAGDFGSPNVPEMVITFNSTHNTSGTTFHFSEYSGDWADHLRVVFYDSSDVTIRDDTYHPSSAVFSTNQAITGFKKILIGLHSTNKTQRRARLSLIEFDNMAVFSDSEVKSGILKEAIDPSALELPVNTLDLQLFSADGNFSIVNPAGFYANLKNKEPCEAYEVVNNLPTYLGRFYLDSWESQSENLATFRASDAVGLLDSNVFLGDLYQQGVLAPNLIGGLMSGTHTQYSLDAYWNSFGITGLLLVQTSREALQKMVFSLMNYSALTRAIVNSTRSKLINIGTIQPASVLDAWDYELTAADVGLNPNLILKPLVTDVEIIGYTYFGTTGSSQIYNASAPSGTSTLIFSEPHANYVASAGTILLTSANFINLSLPSTQNITITATNIITPQHHFTYHNTLTPSWALANLVTIDDPLIPSVSVLNTARMSLEYFKGRYKLKAKFFAPGFSPGNSILVNVQDSKQLSGYVEKMNTDLANGFVSEVEIVGVIL